MNYVDYNDASLKLQRVRQYEQLVIAFNLPTQ